MINTLRSLFLCLMFISPVFASEQAYTQAVFDKLIQQGQPVLVSIHADWCPTCRAQAPVLSKLLKQNEYQKINALRVDFDQQKDVLKALKVDRQSTLIVFKAGQEVGRSLGDTSEDAIAALLKKAL